MNKQEIQDILTRYQNGNASPEEELLLKLWYDEEADRSDWVSDQDEQVLLDSLKKKIDAEIDAEVKKDRWNLNWRWYAAAVIFILFGAGGFYFYTTNQKSAVNSYVKNDIGPGGNKAVLTLADGHKISLTDVGDGQLAIQSGIAIQKTADGHLVYTVNDKASAETSGSVSYNTISTPKGGRYQINLPDGTRVWLNSESSLKFPVSFAGLKERKVDLIGEAYFEVNKNRRPFRVSNKEQMVEVYGTHFNVMSYTNENFIETTLLEGKVGVKAGTEETFITPGEQTQLRQGQLKILKNVDLDAVVAWKNDIFQFDSTDIQKVMRQIERWYNVDVTYVGDKPNVQFTGVIPKKANISRILEVLEQTCAVKFEINGQQIRVTNHKTKH
uniref:FecR family protein n=1 Tax=Pedobacter schmidteae TaxID=2201271 RepID=UPI000EAC54FE|nr:FecR family protein [Pedobacter schmidteae]